MSDILYVCPDDCPGGAIEEKPGPCPACGKPLKRQPVMGLNLLSSAMANECKRYLARKKAAERSEG